MCPCPRPDLSGHLDTPGDKTTNCCWYGFRSDGRNSTTATAVTTVGPASVVDMMSPVSDYPAIKVDQQDTIFNVL